MVAGSGRFPPVLGRRKNASARVYVRAGTGAISVNGSSLVEVGMRRMYVVVLPDGESAGPGVGAAGGGAAVRRGGRVGAREWRRNDGTGGGGAAGAGEGAGDVRERAGTRAVAG